MKQKIILFFSIIIIVAANVYSFEWVLFRDVRLIAENVNIDFSLFPTKNVWTENIPSPIINTRNKRLNESLILESMNQGPNFNGKFRIVEYESEFGGREFFIIDLNFGLVYEGFTRNFHGLQFTLCSSMIVINPIESMPYEDDEYVSNSGPIIGKWDEQYFIFLVSINARPWFW